MFLPLSYSHWNDLGRFLHKSTYDIIYYEPCYLFFEDKNQA